MSTSIQEYRTVGPDAIDIGGFGSFEMNDGTVVYDRGGDNAWIHSTAAVDLLNAR